MKQMRYHSANAAVDISNALDNLAMTATADHNIVAQLIQVNVELVKMTKTLMKQLQEAMSTNQQLTKMLKSGSTKKSGLAHMAFIKKVTRSSL